MPIITGHSDTATTDTASTVWFLKKPTGDNIFITRITIYSIKWIEFGKWFAYLDTLDGKFPWVILGRKTLPMVSPWGAVFWEGRVEWPHNYRIRCQGKTQEATNTIYWFIHYEIVPREVKKKGWGQ